MLDSFMTGLSYGVGFLTGLVLFLLVALVANLILDLIGWLLYKSFIFLSFVPVYLVRQAKRNQYRKVGC